MPQQIQSQDQVVQSHSSSMLGNLMGLLAPFLPGPAGTAASVGSKALSAAHGTPPTIQASSPQMTTPGQSSESNSNTQQSATQSETQPAASTSHEAQHQEQPTQVDMTSSAAAAGSDAGEAANRKAAALSFLQSNPMVASHLAQNPDVALGFSNFAKELHQILAPVAATDQMQQQQQLNQQQQQQNGGISA